MPLAQKEADAEGKQKEIALSKVERLAVKLRELNIDLVQRGINNPSVKRGEKAYYTRFLPSYLLLPAFCLLVLDTI